MHIKKTSSLVLTADKGRQRCGDLRRDEARGQRRAEGGVQAEATRQKGDGEERKEGRQGDDHAQLQQVFADELREKTN